MDGPTNKAERLALAAAVAPSLRSASAETKRRPLKTYDKDGNIVRHIELARFQESLLARHKIEIQTDEGIRPEEHVCTDCGAFIKTAKSGRVRKVCTKCEQQRYISKLPFGVCYVCQKTTQTRVTKKRAESGKYRCRECVDWSQARKKNAEVLVGEKREEWKRKISESNKRYRKSNKYSSEKHAEIMRRVVNEKTFEERSKAARKAVASRNPEKFSKAVSESMSFEQRSTLSRANMAKRTKEQKSVAAKKAWATRRARQKEKTA